MDHFLPPRPVENNPAFDRYGSDVPAHPIVLSIPHAGRSYDSDLLARARVGPEVLRRLEDRWADLLALPLIERGYSVVVARAPRAMIDLNRHEREVDPGMVTGLPREMALRTSQKLRGGLGLIPRRLAGAAELWRGPLPWAEVARRIDTVHRPYHAVLDRLLKAARDAHGHAILIDLHSMPPLPPTAAGQMSPSLVLGDRFGQTAAARLTTLAGDVAAGHGFLAAQNHPYAGDHMIERHGKPAHAIHALQVEIDRAFYLDIALEQPGPGLARMQALVSALAEALANDLPRADFAMAAE
ncbi:N-formylglutamate amidohydrolase [Sphingobium baderi]|uniref:N-formylglutamate amidohydrolase n=1 Tax=Sphingobium baderi TaxID=1332080 RepID=A0A0S3F3E0_9SPHN|nr:N-formylglutamate amidohydrolase [Sphingobium baderi]ALR22219.1 N-formylglutamate amidohydrolase [Sphingobium baderi]